MPAFLAPLALQGLRIGGTALSGVLLDLLMRLFRKGGRRQIGRAIRGVVPGARKHLAKRAAITGAGFAGFDIAFQALGLSPEAELDAANRNLKGFVDDVSLSETPDLEQLLAMIGDQPIEDSSGLFL